MSELSFPKSWTVRAISEIAELGNGGTPPKANTAFWGGGKIPFVTAADLTATYVSDGRTYLTKAGLNSGKTAVCEPGDLLVGTRTRVGNCAIAKARMGASQDITCVRLAKECLPEFYRYYFAHAAARLAFYSQGTSILGITREILDDLPIPVPPLAEQRRLVARIEALTSRLEQARQARQAALAEADRSSRAIIAATFAALDHAPTKKLGDIAGIIGGNSIPENGPRSESEDDRVGLMKVSDMNTEGNESVVTSCRLETTRAHAAQKRLRVVPRGAVVFPKRGGAIATNKKRTLAIPAALDPNMMGVFPLEGSGLSSDFLRWWFESIDLAELQEDGGIPQVNKKHLAPLAIPVPLLAEQRRIVARLDDLSAKHTELRRLQTETAAALAAFTPALLAQAFKGEL